MSTRSLQADLIDQILWGNISSFWARGYDPENRNALSAIYEAYFNVLDAENIRLFELNQAKSLPSCPVITQRRWVRLDLNKYQQMKAFLQYINLNAKVNVQPGDLFNDSIPDLAAEHWHLSFPWRINATGTNTNIDL